MFAAPQFITGHFTTRRVFLADKEYGLALDALVKGCSDVLLLSSDRTRVHLGRRKVEPQPDWWFVGGRSRPGDTTTAAASRNVKREVGLDIEESRFEVVGNYSMVWNYRVQPPTTNGTADLSTIHAVTLTSDEELLVSGITFDVDEYSESKWWDINIIVKNEGARYHPLLVNSLKSLRAKDALLLLERAIDDNENDINAVAEKAITFIKRVKEAKVNELSVKVVFDSVNLKYIPQEVEKEEELSLKRLKTTEIKNSNIS